MGKLSSKLRKKENNANISFDQLHLPKLHENILKYHRLNLFKHTAFIYLNTLMVSWRIRNLRIPLLFFY